MSRPFVQKNEFEEKLIELVYDQLKPSKFVTDASGWKEHWKRIRNQWLAYKRKLTTKSGQESGNPPFFRHEKSMRFCEAPVETECLNSTISNVTDASDAGSPLGNFLDETYDTVSSENGLEISVPNASNIEFPQTSHYQSRQTKKARLDPFGEELLKVVQGKEMTDIQHLCNSVATQLAKIHHKDPKASALLQNQILNLVSETEIAVLHQSAHH
ncbi:unnamed protein product [Allacma fusca]|uniref:Uncharacterized protein n=1 Tax=Allacma fusca TaxID=39272 RepID=A0A8J2KHC8_9HEXA|nr:unnamed protein product [Allacma fusca]